MAAALDVQGSIDVSFDAGRGRLVGEGRKLVFEVEEPANLHGLVGRRSLRTIAQWLHSAGITLHVRSGERLLVLAGHDAGTGVWGRLLRVPHVRLTPRFALSSILPRRPGRAETSRRA